MDVNRRSLAWQDRHHHDGERPAGLTTVERHVHYPLIAEIDYPAVGRRLMDVTYQPAFDDHEHQIRPLRGRGFSF